jgi:tetratricopeptide (TPR) repeat protein
MQEHVDHVEEISFKKFFTPFTTSKAIHWIIIIGFIVYINSLLNGFVIDDVGVIVTNPLVHSFTTIPQILFNQSSSQLSSNYYRPIPSIFYALIYTFFQNITFPYHVIQLLLHIGNAILVFLIFKKYIKLNFSFFLSLLFLIHPINEETVVYIANLQDVLFTFFGLLAFYLLQLKGERQRYIIYASILLLFSVLSKETGFLFIFIIFLYLYLFKKKRLLLYSLLAIAICIVYSSLRFISHVPLQKDPLVPIMRMSFGERMINVPAIAFYYIKSFLFPKDLVALHSWVITQIQFNNFFIPLFFDLLFLFSIVFVFLIVSKKANEKKIAILFLTWFFIGFCFHLQLFPIDMTVADRYFYFPCIGLLGLLGLFMQQLKIKENYKKAFLFFGIVLLIIFSIRTVVRNTNWINQVTLISDDEKIEPNDYLIDFTYGLDMVQQNNYDAAIPFIIQSIKLYPQSWKAWLTLGAIEYQKGNLKLSQQAYQQSISIRNSSLGYEDLALILLQNHTNLTKTVLFLRRATVLYPTSEKLWYYRLLVEYKLRNYSNALLSAKNYYLLTGDAESKSIYMRILQKQPLTITL